MATRATRANQTGRGFRELVGVVVGAGRMDKTVTVRVGGTKWHQGLAKYFKSPKQHLVHDPNNSLRLGDVLTIVPGWRTSRHKRHIVNRMILPAGEPLDQRPPIPTEEERLADRAADFAAKKRRKAVAEGERIEAAIKRAEKLPKKVQKSLHQLRNSGIGAMLRARGELEERLAKEEQKMTDKLAKWRKRFSQSEYWMALKEHREKIAADKAMRRAKEEAEAAWAVAQAAAAAAKSKAEGDAEVEPDAEAETNKTAADTSPNEDERASGKENEGEVDSNKVTITKKSDNEQKRMDATEEDDKEVGPEDLEKDLNEKTVASAPASETETSGTQKKKKNDTKPS